MNINYDIVQHNVPDCDVINVPDLSETSSDQYSYTLGYRHGTCMGRVRGEEAGEITGKRFVQSLGTPEALADRSQTGTQVLNRIMSERRETFDSIMNEYISDDYKKFDKDSQIVIRRNFEVPEQTARGFLDAYRLNFEPTYRDSFTRTYDIGRTSDEEQFNSHSLGSADARRVVDVMTETYSNQSDYLSEHASKLGRRDAIERGKINLRRLMDPLDTSEYDSLEDLMEKYREDTVSSAIIQNAINEVSDANILTTLEQNLNDSVEQFKFRHPTCDEECVKSYTVGYETSYLKALRDKLRDHLREVYDEQFISTYRLAYEDTLQDLSNELAISMEGILIDYDDVINSTIRREIENMTKQGREAGGRAGMKAGFYRARDLENGTEINENLIGVYREIDSDTYYLNTIEHPDIDVDDDILTRLLTMRYKAAYQDAFNTLYSTGFNMNQDQFIDRLMALHPYISRPLQFFQDEYDRAHGRS